VLTRPLASYQVTATSYTKKVHKRPRIFLHDFSDRVTGYFLKLNDLDTRKYRLAHSCSLSLICSQMENRMPIATGLNALPSSWERFYRSGMLLRLTRLVKMERFPLPSLTSLMRR
jgi:hypothetical protein